MTTPKNHAAEALRRRRAFYLQIPRETLRAAQARRPTPRATASTSPTPDIRVHPTTPQPTPAKPKHLTPPD
jgi:hypothetical protein